MSESSRGSLERAVTDRGDVLRPALRRFACLSGVLLAVVLVGVYVVSWRVARDETIDQATLLSEQVTTVVAASQVDAALRSGETAARKQTTSALAAYLAHHGAFEHLVVWDPTGRPLWADTPDRLLERVRFSPRLQSAIAAGESVVSLPGEADVEEDLVRSTERRVTSAVRSIEVYTPSRDVDGDPFVMESYVDPGQLATDQREVLRGLLPVALGGLLLFAVATFPLAWSLAVRVDHERLRRSELLRRSLLFWHDERRQLAQELHDGITQDLSAAGYAMPSIRRALGEDQATARDTVTMVEEVLQRDARTVRSLIYDLVPTDLDGGLGPALEALVARHRDSGVLIELTSPDHFVLDHTVATLAYRVVREGLRNVVKHARAREARLLVTTRGADLEVELTDDGAGLASGSRPVGQGQDGEHVGLRLLSTLVAELGGDLRLDDLADLPSASPAGGVPHGARLRLRLPSSLPG